MKIIDNVMPQRDFDRVHSRFFDYWNEPVLWAYSPSQVLLKDGSSDESFFFHVLYAGPEPSSDALVDNMGPVPSISPLFKMFTPLMGAIGCTTPLRMRLNLLINRNKHIRGIEHTDEITKNMDHNTAIFYLNTCNGKTVVDGTEVESVANRVVIFPANTPHYVVSQTDTDRRIVLNINYY